MPRAIPLSDPRAIVERHHAGQTLDTIARLGLDLAVRDGPLPLAALPAHGEAGLIPDYHRCGRRPRPADPDDPGRLLVEPTGGPSRCGDQGVAVLPG